jgi:hypothetical protein
MNLFFWRRPKPQEPINAEFQYRGASTTITIPVCETADSQVIPLLAARMDDAAASMSAYLSTQLWPKPAWYWRAWGRVRDTALVLVGKRYAVTAEVAFHRCDDDDYDEGEW